MNGSLLLTQTQAAELLGVSRKTVERMIVDGSLAQVRVRPKAQPRVRRADILRIVAGEGSS